MLLPSSGWVLTHDKPRVNMGASGHPHSPASVPPRKEVSEAEWSSRSKSDEEWTNLCLMPRTLILQISSPSSSYYTELTTVPVSFDGLLLVSVPSGGFFQMFRNTILS